MNKYEAEINQILAEVAEVKQEVLSINATDPDAILKMSRVGTKLHELDRRLTKIENEIYKEH